MKHGTFGTLLGAGLLAGLLAGCTMQGPANLRVHEADLYGGSTDRIVWVYGGLTGSGSSTIKLGGQSATLRPQIADPLGLQGTLSVNGAATYRAKSSSVFPAVSVIRTGDAFAVQANRDLSAVYYTDGGRWFRLTGALKNGAAVNVAARASAFIRGAGSLSDLEADALGTALSRQGALAVAVLASVPDAPISAEPKPQEQQQTGLYILPGVVNAGSAPVASSGDSTVVVSADPNATGASVSTNPQPPSTGTVAVRELAHGVNSAQSSGGASATLSRSLTELAQVWRIANGAITPQPLLPSVDFSQGSVVTVFAGQKPSGGYGVRFVNATLTGGTLTLTVEFTSPPSGTFTTQSLTSPWLALSVQGGFSQVVVKDTAGNTVQVSQ